MEAKQNSLLKSTILFSLFVFLAQILGLLRDLYLAKIFGVSQVLDIYYMAFKIPDFLNVFYGVFLGSVVFIPLLTATKTKEEKIEKVNSVGSMVLSFVVLVGLLLFIFMPLLVNFLVPSWGIEQKSLLLNLSRILLVAQFFFPVGILAGSLAMIYERPFFMAVSGFVYNFFILFGSILFTPFWGIYGVIFGIILGAFMFAVVQILPKEVRGILFQFKFEFNFTEWKKFFKNNLGRFVAVFAYQLFGVLLLYIAAFAGAGGVSVFSISYNIFLALFFVLGASLSTAAMPNISRLHVEGNFTKQKENLNNSLIYMTFIGVFVSLFGFIFAQDIVKILYHFSNISAEKEILIAQTLALLILALPFFNLLEIVRKYFYSTNQIKMASLMTISLLVSVVVSSFILNKVFSFPVLQTLAFSILIANIFCLILVLFFLENKKQIDIKTFFTNSYKVFLISFLSYFNFTFLQKFIENIFENYFLEVFLKGFVVLFTFILFVFVLNDKIGKNILLHFKKIFL